MSFYAQKASKFMRKASVHDDKINTKVYLKHFLENRMIMEVYKVLVAVASFLHLNSKTAI